MKQYAMIVTICCLVLSASIGFAGTGSDGKTASGGSPPQSKPSQSGDESKLDVLVGLSGGTIVSPDSMEAPQAVCLENCRRVDVGRDHKVKRSVSGSSSLGLTAGLDYSFTPFISGGLRARAKTVTGSWSWTMVALDALPSFQYPIREGSVIPYIGPIGGVSMVTSAGSDKRFHVEPTLNWHAGGVIGTKYSISESLGGFVELSLRRDGAKFDGEYDGKRSTSTGLETDWSHLSAGLTAGLVF